MTPETLLTIAAALFLLLPAAYALVTALLEPKRQQRHAEAVLRAGNAANGILSPAFPGDKLTPSQCRVRSLCANALRA